tara:strand:+ start:93 stop:671 length:579 start_codon:yes stop_codon:yes gene_type:complete
MPIKTLSDFKGKLLGGGARPNLFDVTITDCPFATTFDQDVFQFMCKAASLPPQNIANLDVPFRGRIFKVAGDRTIDNWSITIINDEDFRIREAFEQWTEGIASLDNNMGATNPNNYMSKAFVTQLGRGEKKQSTGPGGEERAKLYQYEFRDIWPVNVSNIDLSYDTSDTIEEFTVEFAVQTIIRRPDNQIVS